MNGKRQYLAKDIPTTTIAKATKAGGFETRPYILCVLLRALRLDFSYFVLFVPSFENTGWRGLGQFKQNPSIPSFQHGVLESRLTWMFPEVSLRTMDAGHPCRHDEDLHFHVLWASVRS